MSLLGVDVSHWQGVIDWGKARAAGVQFAFAKATEDDNYTDPRFDTNIAGMRSAGVIPGAYHFLRPGNVAGQADRFCRTAPPDVIHALDVEASSLDVAGWVKRYRASYPDKTLLIYTGRDLWTRAGGGKTSDPVQYPLWVAGYVPNRYLPTGSITTVAGLIGTNRGGVPFGGWSAPLFMQFTDSALVPGIPAKCDGDIFYGTRTELEALTSATPIGGSTDMPLTNADAKLIWDTTDVILGQTPAGSLHEIDLRTAAANLRDRAKDGVAAALNDPEHPLTVRLAELESTLNAILTAVTEPPAP